MTCYRRLPFDGLKNARELGGWPIKGGGATAYGAFIRSELPRELSEADLELLRELNVTASIDLRGEREVTSRPSAMRDAPGVEYCSLPLFDARAAALAGGGEALKGLTWGKAYIAMAEGQKKWVRDALELISGLSGCVMYNCTTGKDRTGLLTALLLGIAGVDDRDIIADYCVSQVYMFPVYAELEKHFPFRTPDGGLDLTNPFFRTEPENMETLLDHINEKYGGMAGYALSCGAGESALKTIKRRLTAV